MNRRIDPTPARNLRWPACPAATIFSFAAPCPITLIAAAEEALVAVLLAPVAEMTTAPCPVA